MTEQKTGGQKRGEQKRTQLNTAKQTGADSRLVYSTDGGRLCPQCQRKLTHCVCGDSKPAANGDGIVRLHRETKGRGGKAVTLINGLPLSDDALKTLASQLKKKCGVGGATKDGIIEIQGDQRALLKTELEKLGYVVKIAGG